MKLENVKTKRIYGIDTETGEEIVLQGETTASTTRVVRSYDEFVQVYIESLASLCNLAVKSAAVKVLIFIWLKSQPVKDNEDLILFTGSAWIKSCAEYIKADPRSVRDALKRLVEEGFLFTTSMKGKYIMNPQYYFRGSLNTREMMIKHETYIKLETEEPR